MNDEFQILNSKRNELKNLKNEITMVDSKIESIRKMNQQTADKIAAAKLKLEQLEEERCAQDVQLGEVKKNQVELNEEVMRLRIKEIECEKESLLSEKRKENLEQVLEEKRQSLKAARLKFENSQSLLESTKETLEAKTQQIRDMKRTSDQLSNELKCLIQKLNEESELNCNAEGWLIRKNIDFKIGN